MFRIVFWDVLPCKMIVDRRFRVAYCLHLMRGAVRTSETSVNNHFTRQYIPEDNSEHHTRRRENLKSRIERKMFDKMLYELGNLKFERPPFWND
jgi:hypothetical protein